MKKKTDELDARGYTETGVLLRIQMGRDPDR